MSLTVEIEHYNADRAGDSTMALRTALNNIATSIGGVLGGDNTNNLIKGAVCRGILQNDIDITFANNWSGNLYKGIMDGIGELAKTKVEAATVGTSLNFVNSLVKFGNTAMNMGGMSMVGAGAGTTKLYEGSSISSFNVTMKWYTPVDDTYKEAMFALMLLGFPSFRKPVNTGTSASISQVVGDIPVIGKVLAPFTAVIDTLPTLLSYNPVPVTLRIKSNTGDDNYKTAFKLYPLVISTIHFNFSRETHNGIPIVITADVSFEFFEVLGNNGYGKDDFILAGVPVLGNLDNVAAVKRTIIPSGKE